MAECYYVGWLDRKSRESGMLEYAGKTRFARELAIKLEMSYSSLHNPDMLYWWGTDDIEEIARIKAERIAD